MKLCSQSEGTFTSRLIAMAGLRITTTPDGAAALPNYNLEMTFFTISMVIGIGGPSSGVNQIDVQDPSQILH